MQVSTPATVRLTSSIRRLMPASEVLIGAVAVGVVETLNNKMRLFKVRVYLAAAGLMLLLAVVAQ